MVATEFGRTAHINGTEGTDHGTGTVALLAGGAIKGGRVISDWPGLKPANLYQARDLAPTTDLRAALKGVLHDHLGLGERVLAESRVSRQRRGEADEGAGRVDLCRMSGDLRSTVPGLKLERRPPAPGSSPRVRYARSLLR